MPVKAIKSGITKYWTNGQWAAMPVGKNGWTLIEQVLFENPIARRPFAEVSPPRVFPAGGVQLVEVDGLLPVVVNTFSGLATVSLLPGTVDGNIFRWNDSTKVWEEGTGAAPSGTDTQTLRFNGTTLEATSALRNDGLSVSINTAPVVASLLKIKQDTTGTDGIAVERSAASGQIRLYHGSSGVLDTTANNMEIRSAGQISMFPTGGGNTTQLFLTTQNDITVAAGNAGLLRLGSTFAPTTSGGDFAFLKFLPTINQTGASDQDVFFMDFVPTLTSVQGTVHGVRYFPSVGRGFWQPNGAGIVVNHFAGDVGIGPATTAPAQTLHVAGTMRLTGSDGVPTTIAGRDGAGDISTITVSTGLLLSAGVLTATASAGPTGAGVAGQVTFWANPTVLDGSPIFLFNGSNVSIGTTTSTDRLNVDGAAQFFNGKFRFGRYSGTVPAALAAVQIEGKASSISLPATPSEDAALIIRGTSSGGTQEDQSLHFGIDTNSNYGTFIQARDHADYTQYFNLRLNPRGGKISVGRTTSTANTAHVTLFASTFSSSSGAGDYILNLETSEGTARLGFSSGNDLVHSALHYDGVNLIFRTINLRTESQADIRWAIGGATADKMILLKDSDGRLGVGYSSPSGIHSTIQSAGSFSGAQLDTVGSPTFDETKNVVVYTGSSNVTWTLPSASTCPGRRYVLHHANTAGTITISPSITKGNSGNFSTLTAGEWAWVVSTGSGWRGYKFISN